MKKHFVFWSLLFVGVVAAFAQPMPDSMARIEGGTFMMGSPSSEADRNDNEPQHQVTLSAFYMSKYEITQMEWQALMGNSPKPTGANLPVVSISFMDALKYCNKRSEKEGLSSAYTIKGMTASWNKSANGYRLPTEAEWEYACRAGTSTPYYTGAALGVSQANFNGKELKEVGSFEPNAWGLFDMHGNAAEWCWDYLGNYNLSPETNPEGPSSGTMKVVRGGGWNTANVRSLRSAARSSNLAIVKTTSLGFRVVRSAF